MEVSSMDPNKISKVAVVGAGVMGHSIAFVFAKAGIEVGLFDTSEAALVRARELMEGSMEVLARFGKFSMQDREELLDRIRFSSDLEATCADVDFAAEVVPEVLETKRDVFERMEEYCRPDAILASNTSGLDIFTIEVRHPERLVIAHWYAPPYIIPLVEVVGGPSTSPLAVECTAALMERIGKKPIVMKQFTRGFIANKIQNGITIAILELLLGGLATPEEIDRAVKYSLGVRLPIVGVVQTLDCTGLDVTLDIMKSYGISLPMFEEKVACGELGIKTSKGIYDYGGRSEKEVLAKRDGLYLRQLECLEEMDAFEPL
jgi:3-hydroxybutyryl-CoA dehydrogenase